MTEGRPTPASATAAPGFDENQLLQLAAGVEQASEHPLARAIIEAAKARGLPLDEASGFSAPPGKGATANVQGRAVALGNAALMGELDVVTAGFETAAEAARASGATVIHVAIDGRAAGILAIADPIKTSAKAAIAALRSDGLRIVMLTGDNATTARAVASQLDITDIEAGVLPERKGEVVQRLRQQGRRVAMVGDGVNDA